MTVKGAQQTIENTVTSWEGVEAYPHRFGGREFRLGTREIGHIHGDRLVDLPFPIRVREELFSKGEADRHHVLPDSGWVSFYIRRDEDVARAIGLFTRSYGLALEQRSTPRQQDTLQKPKAMK
jgi:hypothetical protein